MLKVVRHDAIALNREVKEEDFEKFMKDELVPFFSKQYKGPTRASVADLKGQSLLKDTKSRRKYLWITKWDGSPDSVRGASFEHTRMIRIGETDAMLKKLETFGKRTTEKIFSELLSIVVSTNK
jgi:hypothetical protein